MFVTIRNENASKMNVINLKHWIVLFIAFYKFNFAQPILRIAPTKICVACFSLVIQKLNPNEYITNSEKSLWCKHVKVDGRSNNRCISNFIAAFEETFPRLV